MPLYSTRLLLRKSHLDILTCVLKVRAMAKKKEKPAADRLYTIVKLAYDATLKQACDLAKIKPNQVDLIQRAGEKNPADLPADYRIVSFDGIQMTISERINGERSVRGFAVTPTP